MHAPGTMKNAPSMVAFFRGTPLYGLAVFSLVAAAAEAASQHKPLPTPHRQFSVVIETTAHQLNATSDYPPYKRYFTVHYDHPARRARIDYEPVPHMPPKSFVRRYDIGFEWMVMEVRQIKECQKSRLREAMPFARYPDALRFMGQVRVRGKLCDHWREDLGEETVEYFETADEGIPLRLTTQAVDEGSAGSSSGEGSGSHGSGARTTTPLMTYDFSKFEARPPDEALFKMASSSASPIFKSSTPLTVGQCERVVQDMGFPYIHFFHVRRAQQKTRRPAVASCPSFSHPCRPAPPSGAQTWMYA